MQLPLGFRLSIEERPATQDCKTVNEALSTYNKQFLHDPKFAHFALFVRDQSQAIHAGLDAYVYGGWLFVHNLWVHGDLRGRGIGRDLMAQAERRAVALGCHSAWLDTFSFQAPAFYQKLGYEVFGVLEYPPEHKRFFLKKQLPPT